MSRESVNDKALAKAKDELALLLDGHWRQICEARDAAAVEAARHGKEKFAYRVSLVVVQEPRGAECAVSCGISYAVKHSDETEPVLVSDQQELGV